MSDSIPALYYTEIVGDARNPPTILAAANFNPTALAIFGKLVVTYDFQRSVNAHLDADPYIPDGWGAQYYVNQNNLWVIPSHITSISPRPTPIQL